MNTGVKSLDESPICVTSYKTPNASVSSLQPQFSHLQRGMMKRPESVQLNDQWKMRFISIQASLSVFGRRIHVLRAAV